MVTTRNQSKRVSEAAPPSAGRRPAKRLRIFPRATPSVAAGRAPDAGDDVSPATDIARRVEEIHAAVTKEDEITSEMLFSTLRRERDALQRARSSETMLCDAERIRSALEAEVKALRLESSASKDLQRDVLAHVGKREAEDRATIERLREENASLRARLAPCFPPSEDSSSACDLGSLAVKHAIERFLTEKHCARTTPHMSMGQLEREFCDMVARGSIALPRGYCVVPGGRGPKNMRTYMKMTVVWSTFNTNEGEVVSPMYMARK